MPAAGLVPPNPPSKPVPFVPELFTPPPLPPAPPIPASPPVPTEAISVEPL